MDEINDGSTDGVDDTIATRGYGFLVDRFHYSIHPNLIRFTSHATIDRHEAYGFLVDAVTYLICYGRGKGPYPVVRIRTG